MSNALFLIVPSILLLLGRKRPGVAQTISGGPFIDSLPDKHGPKRENLILREIERKQRESDWDTSDVEWTTVTQELEGMLVEIPVMTDALKLDGVRVNTTFDTAQKIADVLGVYLLTPHVSDLIEKQSGLNVPPSANSKWMFDGTGAKTHRMIEHSRQVDNKVVNTTPKSGKNPKLVNNPGKYWVNTSRNWEKKGYGANYGWYYAPASGGMIQGPIPGLAHNIQHVDYSQVFRAMGPTVTMHTPQGSIETSMGTILLSPSHRHLIAGSDTKLTELRHPDIPSYSPPIV